MSPKRPYSDAPRDALKVEFARRLQAKLIEKGIKQSELVRLANVHLDKGSQIGRDSVSKYILGMNLPNPIYLTAIAKALGCKPEDLMPTAGLPSTGESLAFDMRQTNDGNVWLRVNQSVPRDDALKIAAILKGSK